MTHPTITALPAVPNRATDTPSQFSTNTDSFLSALPQFRIDVNTFGDWAEAQGVTIEGNATAAAASETAAQGYADDAEGYAQTAQLAANLQGSWDTLTGSAAPPFVVFWEGLNWQLLESIADITAHEPGVSAVWYPVSSALVKTIEDRGFKAMTAYDSGIASKWIEPIAISRFENGVPFAYWGSTSGDGLQKVNRCNLSSGEIETKTVNSAYTASPNDHFAPAVNFLRSGKIFIGCTGHNQDAFVTYDVFDDWDSVGSLTKQFTHPMSPVGYVQCVNINFRTYVFSRMYNSGTDSWSWVYFYSDDDFATVSASFVMLQEQSDQLYMLFRHVNRSVSAGNDRESIVRFLACGNASNMTDRRLMRGTLSYNEVSEFFEYNTSGANVQMDTGGTTFGNLIEIYSAPVGKRFRLSDLTDGNTSAALIIEFDEASPYGNAKNYLLTIPSSGAATKVEIPLPVGVSLPYPTYFTEMCFLRPENPAQQSTDGIEIMVAVDEGGYDSDYLIYLMTYSLTNDSWTKKLVSRINSSVGRYYRPLPVKGGLADIMCPVIREYDTNPPSPAYKNFNGRTEMFWGYSRTNKYSPSQSREKISLSSGVAMLKRKRLTVSQVIELSDANHELQLDFATAGTLTIQPFAKTWFQKGDKFSLVSTGAGVVTIQAAAGVTLNGVVGGSCTIGPYKGAVLTCEGKNDFSIVGGNSDVS